ncbi:MAG: hypothetical protein AMXMBFR59_40800 [Rhodanobacteraceae bacterium]
MITRRSLSCIGIDEQRKLFAEVVRGIPGNHDQRLQAAWHGSYGFEITDAEDLSFGLQVDAFSLTLLDHVPADARTVRQPLLTFLTLTAAHDFSPAELLDAAPSWQITGAIDEVWGCIGRLVSFTPPELARHLEWLERRSRDEEVLLTATTDSSGILTKARAAKLPCLMRGVLDAWPIAKLSLVDFLASFGQLSFGDSLNGGEERLTFGQLLPEAERSESFADLCLPGNWGTGNLPASVRQLCGSLPPNIEPELGIRLTPTSDVESFLCGPDADTPLHTDLVNGCLTCALGPREIVLFGPSQAQEIYACRSLELGDYRKSHIENCRNVDTNAFPLFAEAKRIRLTLYPGDLLYLPAGWFHYIYVQHGPSLAMKFSMGLDETWSGWRDAQTR